jgi:hypothetical protein
VFDFRGCRPQTAIDSEQFFGLFWTPVFAKKKFVLFSCVVERRTLLRVIFGVVVFFQVDAPWVKHFVNAEDDDLYILVG